MPTIGNEHVDRAYIAHEGQFVGSSKLVLVVETNLQTDPQHPDFDLGKLKKLIDQCGAYVRRRNRQVEEFRIVPVKA